MLYELEQCDEFLMDCTALPLYTSLSTSCPLQMRGPVLFPGWNPNGLYPRHNNGIQKRKVFGGAGNQVSLTPTNTGIKIPLSSPFR